MSELIHDADGPLEFDALLAKGAGAIRELGGQALKLLIRNEARAMSLIEERPPRPTEALRAFHAQHDQMPPDVLAAQ